MENLEDEDSSKTTFCFVDYISLITARCSSSSFSGVSVRIWQLSFLRLWLDATLVVAHGKGWMSSGDAWEE
jgi:hypothetical protein